VHTSRDVARVAVSGRPPPRVHVRLLLSLASGRLAFRGVTYGSGVVLLTAWGYGDFNRYAAAVGPTIWLTGLVAAGPEKAALKLVPRSSWAQADLVGSLRTLVGYLPIPVLAVVAAAVAAAPRSTTTLYLAAAAGQVVLGCTLLGIALFRALGVYGRDVAHYFGLSAGTVVMTGLTWWAGLPPIVYICGLLVVTAVLNTTLVRGLQRYVLTSTRRGRVRRLLAGTAVLMGASEVLPTLATGVLYVELALTRHADASGNLLLILTGWSFVTAASYFLQRTFQPAASVRGVSAGTVRPQQRALRIARLCIWLTVAYLATTVTVLLTTTAASWSLPLMIGLLLAHTPAHLLMGYGAFLLENADAAGLRLSALGAATGTVAVVLVGALTIPLGGAPGAICALAAMELAVSTSFWFRLRSPRIPGRVQRGKTDKSEGK
jgi:hypothetical protein